MRQGTGACKWEGMIVGEGLRLDLQGIAISCANWQLQTHKPAGQSESIAGCLMEVESCFSQRQLLHELKLSHNEGLHRHDDDALRRRPCVSPGPRPRAGDQKSTTSARMPRETSSARACSASLRRA